MVLETGKHQKLPENFEPISREIGDLTPSTDPFIFVSIIALFFAFFFPIAGLIMGLIVLRKIRKDPHLPGKRIAIAAILVGSIFTILVVVYVLGIGLLISKRII